MFLNCGTSLLLVIRMTALSYKNLVNMYVPMGHIMNSSGPLVARGPLFAHP